MLSVVDYFGTMSLAVHASSKLKALTSYDNFCIEIIPCILTTFDGDVMFKLPPPLC